MTKVEEVARDGFPASGMGVGLAERISKIHTQVGAAIDAALNTPASAHSTPAALTEEQ